MTVLEGLKHRDYMGQEDKWPEWLGDIDDFPTAVGGCGDPGSRKRRDGANGGKSLTIGLQPRGRAGIGHRCPPIGGV